MSRRHGLRKFRKATFMNLEDRNVAFLNLSARTHGLATSAAEISRAAATSCSASQGRSSPPIP